MPTPSFEKRLRRRSGSRVRLSFKTSRGYNREVTARVRSVDWDATTSQYVFVGSDVRGTRGARSSQLRVPTNMIHRPVRTV